MVKSTRSGCFNGDLITFKNGQICYLYLCISVPVYFYVSLKFRIKYELRQKQFYQLIITKSIANMNIARITTSIETKSTIDSIQFPFFSIITAIF